MNKFLRITFLSLLTLLFSGQTFAAEVTDELTNSTFGITANQYAETSGIKATSQAVYAAYSAGGNKSIQLRSKDETSGIVTTTSGGKVKSVTIVFNSSTTQPRTVDIYGKNSAYSTSADLYTSKQGTLLGSISNTESADVKSVTVSGDYHFIGIRSKENAVYIDKITIVWEEDEVSGTGGNGEEEPTVEAKVVTPPAGLQTEDWTFEANWNTNNEVEEIVRSIKIGFDANDVYVQGFSYDFEDAWLKGTLSADKKHITFASPQFYGSEEYQDELYENYFAAYSYTTEGLVESLTVGYDATAGTMSWDSDMLMLENSTGTSVAPWGYYTNVSIYKGAPVMPEPVVAPENLEVSEYRMKCQSVNPMQQEGEDYEDYYMARAAEDDNTVEDTYEYAPYEIDVFVGFDGNDVYIKGFSANLPDAWVKGTLADGKVTIPSSQYYGKHVEDFYGLYTEERDLYFKGYNTKTVEEADVVFTLDATTQTLTLDKDTWLIESTLKNSISANSILSDMTLQPIEEKAVKPANPDVLSYMAYNETKGYGYAIFNMPMVDVDGNNLLLSKLYFKVYLDDEQHPLTFTTDVYTGLTQDLTEVPFTFSDPNYDFLAYDPGFYFYEPLTCKKIGVQSIYYGGGQTNVSEIGWLDISDESGISDLTTKQGQPGAVYSLSGMKQNAGNLKQGLYIRGGKKFVVK